MIVYRIEIEPCSTRRDGYVMNFRAACPSVPGAEAFGAGEDEALTALPARVAEAMIALFRADQPMPGCDFVEAGDLAVIAPFTWRVP